jgi:hypothetical protein
MRLQPVGDVARLEIVREEELDAAKPGLGRRTETVEELDLLEHHAEISGEIRQSVLPCLCAATVGTLVRRPRG